MSVPEVALALAGQEAPPIGDVGEPTPAPVEDTDPTGEDTPVEPDDTDYDDCDRTWTGSATGECCECKLKLSFCAN